MNFGTTRIISAIGVAGATLLGSACGQGADTTSSVGDTNQSASDALMAIQSCQGQARGCLDAGDAQGCDDALRACLGRALPDAATAPSHGGEDHDGAPGHDDAEPEVDDTPDGARSLPDAAIAALTKPRAFDGGPPALACVDALHTCLASQTRPMDCADQARACLTGGHEAGKP